MALLASVAYHLLRALRCLFCALRLLARSTCRLRAVIPVVPSLGQQLLCGRRGAAFVASKRQAIAAEGAQLLPLARVWMGPDAELFRAHPPSYGHAPHSIQRPEQAQRPQHVPAPVAAELEAHGRVDARLLVVRRDPCRSRSAKASVCEYISFPLLATPLDSARRRKRQSR